MSLAKFRQRFASAIFNGMDSLGSISPARAMRKRRVEQARKAGGGVIVDIQPLLCRMKVEPDTFFADMYIRDFYEPDFLRCLKSTVKEGMTCVDAGASFGQYSLCMSALAGPGGRVIAFEPTPRTYGMLKENLSLNPSLKVCAENAALYESDGELEFHVGPPGFEGYNSAGEIVSHPGASGQAFEPVKVKCFKLDGYLAERGISKVDVVKIDVEGAEIHVLKGMQETLDRSPDATLFIEFADQTTKGFGYRARDIGAWLGERGWQIHLVHKFGRISKAELDQPWFGQMVVVKKSAAAAGE